MKKLIIAALVGGLILFFYSYLSWGLLGLHRDTQQYTPNQDEVLKYLSENLEEGYYFLPTVPDGASLEEEQAAMVAAEGKPWAQVYFHKSMTTNMGLNLLRGFAVDFVAILLLAWILLKIPNATFSTILISSVSIGIIVYLTDTYTKSIWYEFPTIMDLADNLISFGLVGAWLGYWLRK